MSWRTVVISNRAKLDYQMGFMVIRGENVQRIHLSEISVLIVENTAVSITGYLLSELIKQKIKVIFCDEKRNPQSELMPYYGSHDTSAKVLEQVRWDDSTKSAVWTEIVKNKIYQQSLLLRELQLSKADQLAGYVTQVSDGDSSNREGFAAKVYFNALFGKGFIREEDSPINAALNYGYTLILSAFAREINANGYITQLGLAHHNMFNSFNLASDLMEPFRPIVDRQVYRLLPKVFDKDEKRFMLDILNVQVRIREKKYYLSQAITFYCRGIFSALDENDLDKLVFYSYEL